MPTSMASKWLHQRFKKLLAQPSQLRTIFGVFAVSFAVKSRVSIAKLGKNGRVETKCLPFAP
jgi:hypothetical protein